MERRRREEEEEEEEEEKRTAEVNIELDAKRAYKLCTVPYEHNTIILWCALRAWS